MPGNWEYTCFAFQQQKKAPLFVLFHAKVSEIIQWAGIDELGPKSWGPQREGKEARVDAITNFLSADPRNSIPTAIIVAFGQGMSKLKEANPYQLQIQVEDQKAATIVDGQHRLMGLSEFDPNIEVSVVGLLEVDPVEKAFQFLVINNKASRVPATHTKALLARMQQTNLSQRLKGARLAFDVSGIRDVDLVNSIEDSPFYQMIDWTITPKDGRLVPATAIEQSLEYIGGLGIPEFDDRDVRRSVLLAIWKAIKEHWGDLWVEDSRLISKVGILSLTRFVADRITNWADNDEINIEITDLSQIEKQTKKIVSYMDKQFWTVPWSEKARGGFDTTQGRDRVLAAITQLFRNGRREIPWYTDIDIIDRTAATE
jgi:DGQHR domain-containing protein